MPKGIQRKRTKGWRMPPGTVNVAPYQVGEPFHGQALRPRKRPLISTERYSASIPSRPRTARQGFGLLVDQPHCHRNVLLKAANE